MIANRTRVRVAPAGPRRRRAPWAPLLVSGATALVAVLLAPTPLPAAPVQEAPPAATAATCGPGSTAAAALGYTNVAFSDDFASFDEQKWMVYSGPSEHQYGQFTAAGGGQRTREQISVADGVMKITGLPNGNTAGMNTERSHEQQYGLWEARVKLPAAQFNYHSVLILMAGGTELDFMEAMEPTGRTVNGFMHLPSGDDNGEVTLADNEWHNWAIEWTPDRLRLYLDGQKWHETAAGAQIPTGPGHMTIQLDWFPQDHGPDRTGTAELSVDWVNIYRPPAGQAGTGATPAGGADNCAGASTPGGNGFEQRAPEPAPPAGNSGGTPTSDSGVADDSMTGEVVGGCRVWVHPVKEVLDRFAPEAPDGSVVLLFCARYDPRTGQVTHRTFVF
jgi:beta-glucanase (GH16 family)